jgi:regulator of RNase E activity RraA
VLKEVGFRIREHIERPSKKLVEAFREVSTASITDAMGRFGAMESEIKPLFGGVRMVGPALTVKTRPGDNLMCHKANSLVEDGDIMVIDAGAYTRVAVWGELMTLIAKAKGCAGIVIDGAVRDSARIKEIGFPLFARAIAPCVGHKDGPGEINFPIQCGGVQVEPGDIIAGDDDGIAVVPAKDAKLILKKAKEFEAKGVKRRKEIESGGPLVPDFVDKTLREKGVI